jgi:tetratricopeptide (TPR) repeat protein
MSGSAFSQSVRKLLKYGDIAFSEGNYYGAIFSYKSALEQSKIPKIAYKYAESCRMNHDYPEAEKWYLFARSKEHEKYPLADFWLGDVYKSMADYQKAQISFSKFLKYTEDNQIKTEPFYQEKAKYEILACEKAFYYKLEPVGVDIDHLDTNINSVYSEFGISEINDSLFLYGSLRPFVQKSDTMFLARIFKSGNDIFYPEQDTQTDSATLDLTHYTNPAFSKKNQTFYFCSSAMDKSELTSSIYRSALQNGKFSKPEKLPDDINLPGSISTQPSVAETADADYLLFVSNRENGVGNLDIWFCKINADGSFGEVLNAGSNLNHLEKSERFYLKQTSSINSIDDEITPFYNSLDSTLYFSSKWHYSMGGFDIFQIKGDFIKWDEPRNLGYPLNTSDNEVYYSVFPNNGSAYFSSNRKGSLSYNNDRCCNDIYTHKIPKFVDIKEIEENQTVILEDEIKLLVPLTLYFHNDEPNPRTKDTTTQYSYPQTYFSYINMLEEYKTEYSKGLKKDKKESANETIQTFFESEVNKGYEDLNKFTLLLEQLLPKGEQIDITIKGYASPLHATDYNVNLSKRRINSLVNYFCQYNDSLFYPYIKSGQLVIFEEAYGEETASTTISDNLSDLKGSVYSPDAAYERKIKVIAISLERKKD